MPTVRKSRVSKTAVKLSEKKPAEKTVDDLVGAPQEVPELPVNDAPQIEKGDVAVITSETLPPAPTSGYQPYRNNYYSERMIPDANLPTESVEGILDIATEGSGLLRPKFAPSDNDIYISASQIRRFNLRVGDKVGGQARRPKENERYWGLLKVETVNGKPVDETANRADMDDLVAIYPDMRIELSTGKEPLTTRMIDMVAPIGFGQRGLIVSAPKAGKTWLIKDIIAGIAKNYPEDGKAKGKPKTHLMAVLIGERPEEVTDIKRHVQQVTNGLGEVASSNFDEAPQNQTRVGELALERAKRLVEDGHDVVIVLDSITRMARAYNLALPTSGRTLTGGFDPVALFPAKKFFGAARKIENAGSLTIIGTCLVDTGSRMDDLIYEEFKGTGNMELHLVRKLADRRVFPAIDVTRSGTRQEELLYGKDELAQVVTMRRMLESFSEDERTETLLSGLKRTETNKEFLENLKTL
jgi:transcription termination factor Rho